MSRRSSSWLRAIVVCALIAQVVFGLVPPGPWAAADSAPPRRLAADVETGNDPPQLINDPAPPGPVSPTAPSSAGIDPGHLTDASLSSRPDPIQLDIAVDTPFVSAGEALTFTLSVVNQTDAPLSGLVLTADAPAACELTRAADLVRTLDGDRLEWSVPGIAAGQRLATAFSCKVADAPPGMSSRGLY